WYGGCPPQDRPAPARRDRISHESPGASACDRETRCPSKSCAHLSHPNSVLSLFVSHWFDVIVLLFACLLLSRTPTSPDVGFEIKSQETFDSIANASNNASVSCGLPTLMR